MNSQEMTAKDNRRHILDQVSTLIRTAPTVEMKQAISKLENTLIWRFKREITNPEDVTVLTAPFTCVDSEGNHYDVNVPEYLDAIRIAKRLCEFANLYREEDIDDTGKQLPPLRIDVIDAERKVVYIAEYIGEGA